LDADSTNAPGYRGERMRLDLNELEMLHDALDALRYEAQKDLDDDDVGPAVARWCYSTIDCCDDLSAKLEVIIETVRDLENEDVACDVKLTPGITDPQVV
jgi:hypothetical protein